MPYGQPHTLCESGAGKQKWLQSPLGFVGLLQRLEPKKGVYMGRIVEQWLELLSLNERDTGSGSGLGPFWVKFPSPPYTCMGFLSVLQFPPNEKRMLA